MKRTSTLAIVVLLAALESLTRGQQPPTFRAGVEVTTLDVSVVDDNGRPVADLRPGEFGVRVDGKDRRVVSAEWIPLASSGAAADMPAPAPPAGYSTNASPTRGRLVLVAVDQPNIRFGGTQLLRSSLNRFIDGLEPADRAAAVALGQGGVSTGFTTDREAVKRAISTMAGTMRVGADINASLTVSQAIEIQEGGVATLERRCGKEPAVGTAAHAAWTACVDPLKLEAFRVEMSARSELTETLTGLTTLLDSLKKIEAPKILVVVTEGFPALLDQPGIVELGTLAAASRTSLYVLRLADEFNLDVASTQQRGATPGENRAESMMREQGAQLLASVARGDVFNVNGTGRPAVDRIEREISGYYLVGVESAPADSDGAAHPVSVQVSRPRTIVRARREYVEVAANRRGIDAGDPVADAIRSPLLANGLTLLATAAVVRDDDPSKVMLLLSAEVGNGYTVPQSVKLAYLITDSRDVVVVNKAANGRLPVRNGDKRPLTFTAEESLPPGDYVWKLAIAEGTRVGSVEHAIHTGPLNAVPARPATTVNSAPAAAAAPRPVVLTVAPRFFRPEDAASAETLKKFDDSVSAEGRTAFNQGVAAFSAGNYAAAEANFRAALQAGFAGGKTAAPMIYLGATFAASGRDAEAIGIWQVALTGSAAFAEIYDWLAEALIRTRDLAEARNILQEAAEKWPADSRFAARLAELSPAGAPR